MNKEHPIIFSAPMIRAILAGEKTQTRRVVKPQPPEGGCIVWLSKNVEDGVATYVTLWRVCDANDKIIKAIDCPYGIPGDHLWVRETWHAAKRYDELKPSFLSINSPLWYAVGGHRDHDGWTIKGKKRPSIFMLRWASRITLEITDVGVEQVTDITERGAVAEGCKTYYYGGYDFDYVDYVPAIANFRRLWDSIDTKRGFGWITNPWCWRISFVRV